MIVSWSTNCAAESSWVPKVICVFRPVSMSSAEQLLVAADARHVDDELAVGRPGGPGVAEGVLGQVGDRARLQVEHEDVADAALERGEHHAPAVGRDVRRLGLVERAQVELVFDLARDDVLQDERARLLGADEVAEPVARRRPRHPRHGVPAAAGRDQELVAVRLVEALGQVADDAAVLARDQDDVGFLVLAVAGDDGNEVARRRRLGGERVGERALLGVGRQVAAVVRRPLLVAERLEAVLQVLLELLVEVLGIDLEGFLVGVVAAADHRLAEREEVLAQPLLAPLGFHELEDRMAQVVDHARAAEAAVFIELRHLRHDVGDRRVAHRHQVERPPVAGHVVGQTLVHPQRHVAPHQRGRDDLELELVGELVDHQPVEQIRRFVHRHQDPLARRLGEGAHAFLRRARDHVLLLELAAGLKEDERDLLRPEVVFQLGADVLIGAFGVARHPLQVRLDLRYRSR